MARYGGPGDLSGSFRYGFLVGHDEIADGSAPFTDKMIMNTGDRVKMFHAVAEIPARYQALFHQYADVPVHGPHAEGFNFLFQYFMDRLRGQMLRARPYQLEYPFAMLALFSLGYHFNNDY